MNETAKILGKVSENWLNPLYPLRCETIQALHVSTGFNARQIDLALSNCFEELTLPKINAYKASSVLDRRSNVGVIFHVLPANVFTAWVHGAVITLLQGHRCLLKPSLREPVFARAWKKSLEEIDASLAEQVEVVGWDEKQVRQSQAVVAYGSDETLQTIRSQLPAGLKFAGYGHKVSLGIIFKEALAEAGDALLDQVRRDVDAFRLQGCLSPQILYVEGAGWPRWGELKVQVDVMPTLKPFARWEEIYKEVERFSPTLSCVGYAGAAERKAFLERELRDTGVSRICALGTMQRPPLAWRNGGIDLVNLLN